MKALDKFILAGSTENAIIAASNIAKHHQTHHKSQRALSKFDAYLKTADVSKLSPSAAE